MSPTGPDPAVLADLAVDVARQAASLVREHAAQGVQVAASKSSEVDVVTTADRASEQLLRRLIRAARPHDALMGEEGEDEPGGSGVRWVLDPIDGTVNFLYGLPQYAISVAAQVEGPDGWESVAGAVLEVSSGSQWSAHIRDGQPVGSRDGLPLRVREAQPLQLMLLATGFSYDSQMRARQAGALVELLPRVRDVRRLGSCALDLCLVASGHLDGYVEEGINLWDRAAGTLVAEAAGARWQVLEGASGRDLLVCGPADSFEVLLGAVLEAGYAAVG